MEIEDIAVDMQLSMKKVNEHIDNWLIFKEYTRAQKHNDTSWFSYFQEAPKKVTDYYTKTESNKNNFFDLISPTSGKQKIKGAAFGLRDFSKVLDDPEALNKLSNDPDVTMEEALEIVMLNDASKAMPFLKNINPLAKKIMDLGESQVDQIKSKHTYKASFKKLRRAINQLLERLDND